MKVEHKPLFRPDIINRELAQFNLDEEVFKLNDAPSRWANFLDKGGGKKHKESEILHDFLTDIFCGILGYKRPSDAPNTYNFSREKYVESDGKVADGVIGYLGDKSSNYIAAIEGKGPLDPIERPYKGRKFSAVDQCYKYAINLPCDWIIVTSTVETRLYYKGADQLTYERFLTSDLATNTRVLKKFVFLLGAKRMVPEDGRCHLYKLLEESRVKSKKLSKEYYTDYSNKRGELFRSILDSNSNIPPLNCLKSTQKILDRVLFCAICEDRGLLPTNTLQKVYELKNPYNPKGKWQNFLDLFKSIDQGNPQIDIPKFNGGLFAPDSDLDTLNLSDEICEIFKDLGEYDYRESSSIDLDEELGQKQFIDVDILGHIFEQSITEIESIKNEKGGVEQAIKKNRFQTRAKIEGAYYTPSYITDFIVKSTVESNLEEQFQNLIQEHLLAAKPSTKSILESPSKFEITELTKFQHKALVSFWTEWQDLLKGFKILDPACGSGAFLISAFDYLANTYRICNDILEELTGSKSLFDLNKQILNDNLYGVDINEEAVEICKLSIWIKTANKGKILTDLSKTIKVGNSIVDDPEVDKKAFKWEVEFKEILGKGGFNVIVGNPPYIRQELIKPFKSHLKKNFKSFKGTADVYVYFYERSINLLHNNGRMGFITTGTFTKAGFAEPFRGWFSKNASFKKIVNFGENQPFENAEMVYPTISIIRKGLKRDSPPKYFFITWNSVPENLSIAFDNCAIDCDERFYENLAWIFQKKEITDLYNRLIRKGSSLKKHSENNVYRGVTTGLNEAFEITNEIKEKLISSDEKNIDLLKELHSGTDIRPGYVKRTSAWLIFTRRGIDLTSYPDIEKYLEEYKNFLLPKPEDWDDEVEWKGRKAGPYKWYEIQDSVEYYKNFEIPKVVWPSIQKQPRFYYDDTKKYFKNSCYFVNVKNIAILAILASRVSWFLISQIAMPLRLRGGLWQHQCIAASMEKLRIPDFSDMELKILNEITNEWTLLAHERSLLISNTLNRIQCDLGPMSREPANGKLKEWWKLSFQMFMNEVNKSFKSTIPVSERTEWEDFLILKKSHFINLTQKMIKKEEELNELVFKLFDISEDDKHLLLDHLKNSSLLYEYGSV